MATVGISYVHGSVAKAKKADVEIVLHFGCFTPPHSDQNEAQNQSIWTAQIGIYFLKRRLHCHFLAALFVSIISVVARDPMQNRAHMITYEHYPKTVNAQ